MRTRSNKKKFGTFCHNCHSTDHYVKTDKGEICCPILKGFTCPLCNVMGHHRPYACKKISIKLVRELAESKKKGNYVNMIRYEYCEYKKYIGIIVWYNIENRNDKSYLASQIFPTAKTETELDLIFMICINDIHCPFGNDCKNKSCLKIHPISINNSKTKYSWPPQQKCID